MGVEGVVTLGELGCAGDTVEIRAIDEAINVDEVPLGETDTLNDIIGLEELD